MTTQKDEPIPDLLDLFGTALKATSQCGLFITIVLLGCAFVPSDTLYMLYPALFMAGATVALAVFSFAIDQVRPKP
jgi:hypothetical protein